MKTNDEMDNGRLYSRLHKSWCFPTCFFGCNMAFTPCRRLVSRSKKRYEKDGFDLDLAYITPKVVVHGFPAVGLEHIYRNPRGEIRRFMDTYHKDHYKVYNFCCEYGRGYDPSVYYGRVERYPFKDHNTPPFGTMVAFANSAKGWMDADKDNVVNMHCKAGKGRAGLMCCVLLVRAGFCQSAIEAMTLYDKERVYNNRGLTVTSQRKYVIFYERLWREIWGVKGNIGDVPATTVYPLPKEPNFRISKVEIVGVNDGILKNVVVDLFQGTHLTPERLDGAKAATPNQTSFDVNATVHGNFKVGVFHKPGSLGKKVKVLELWHNTVFMSVPAAGQTLTMDFPLDQLDVKRKMIKKYGDKITVRLTYTSDGTTASSSKVANETTNASEGVQLVVRDGDNNNTTTPNNTI